MNSNEKDPLDQQLFDALHTFETPPNTAVFEALQSRRAANKSRKFIAWYYLIPAAAASIIVISYWFRFEPTLTPQKQTRNIVSDIRPLKPLEKRLPAKKQYRENSKVTAGNGASHSLVQTEKKEYQPYTKFEPKQAKKVQLQITEPKGKLTLPMLDKALPIVFNSLGFSNLFSDSLPIDTIKALVCENIEIPLAKLGSNNNQDYTDTKQWWLASNYLQLFGRGVVSNNAESFLQPTNEPSTNTAQSAYAFNLIIGKRLYKHFWAWTGLQYQRAVFADMRVYEDYTVGSVKTTGDEMFFHKQYFDLNYTTATLPLGLTFLQQKNKWQLKIDVAAQFNYLLATSSMRFEPASKAIEAPINAASQDRFDRKMFGLSSTVSAGYSIRENLWMNAGLGAIGYRRSYLNPSIYNNNQSANFVLQFGLQYYF